jgi:phosphomannomutase
MHDKYSKEDAEILTIDGVKLLFESSWVHMRKSNTEPIIRVYTESTTTDKAKDLAERFCAELLSLV